MCSVSSADKSCAPHPQRRTVPPSTAPSVCIAAKTYEHPSSSAAHKQQSYYHHYYVCMQSSTSEQTHSRSTMKNQSRHPTLRLSDSAPHWSHSVPEEALCQPDTPSLLTTHKGQQTTPGIGMYSDRVIKRSRMQSKTAIEASMLMG